MHCAKSLTFISFNLYNSPATNQILELAFLVQALAHLELLCPLPSTHCVTSGKSPSLSLILLTCKTDITIPASWDCSRDEWPENRCKRTCKQWGILQIYSFNKHLMSACTCWALFLAMQTQQRARSRTGQLCAPLWGHGLLFQWHQKPMEVLNKSKVMLWFGF